jgi:putative exosortase-associated protein (TIGR04073 family)
MMVALTSVPAFAETAAATSDAGRAQVKNTQVGARNASTGWVEVLDNTHAEAAKGKNTGEHLTGVVAGGAIGVRKGIHRIGAGAIDLLTFWIPKKQPIINPEKARLE